MCVRECVRVSLIVQVRTRESAGVKVRQVRVELREKRVSVSAIVSTTVSSSMSVSLLVNIGVSESMKWELCVRVRE